MQSKKALAFSLGLSYLTAGVGSLGTLNAIWSQVFFGAKLLFPGLLIAIALAASVFVTMCLYNLTVKKAGILLAPYFGWCVFASLLSYELLILNSTYS
ncbi:MAG: TspO/MBR family [Actinomycetota bacterium]|jgi:tryptophan-rich sensory protein